MQPIFVSGRAGLLLYEYVACICVYKFIAAVEKLSLYETDKSQQFTDNKSIK